MNTDFVLVCSRVSAYRYNQDVWTKDGDIVWNIPEDKTGLKHHDNLLFIWVVGVPHVITVYGQQALQTFQELEERIPRDQQVRMRTLGHE